MWLFYFMLMCRHIYTFSASLKPYFSITFYLTGQLATDLLEGADELLEPGLARFLESALLMLIFIPGDLHPINTSATKTSRATPTSKFTVLLL